MGNNYTKYEIIPFVFNQEMEDRLYKNRNEEINYTFPIRALGMNFYSICAPNLKVKSNVFNFSFVGDYYIRIDAHDTKRIVYLQEYKVLGDFKGNYKCECIDLWSSNQFGQYLKNNKNQGLSVLMSSTSEVKILDIITQQMDIDITLHFSAVCPNLCHEEKGYGYCSAKNGKCICKKRIWRRRLSSDMFNWNGVAKRF